MIGAIIGDVVGSRFEWMNIKSKEFDLITEYSRPTDDTVMTLAIAAALLESETKISLLEKNVVTWMQRIGKMYPHYGYGERFMEWLESDNPKPYNSWGNGAAMRVSACAYVANTLEEALHISDIVTGVTHNHSESIKGARAVTESIYLAKEGKTKEEIKNAMNKYYSLDFTLNEIRPTYRFDVSCKGSVPQAIQAFLESSDFEDAIRNAISIGGDSDTIAAITGSIAEAYYGVPISIRKEILSKLDKTQLDILNRFEKKYD